MPRVLFLDISSGSYWRARASIFQGLRILEAQTLVKAGALLSVPTDTVAAEYGPYKAGEGRTRRTSSDSTPLARQVEWARGLADALDGVLLEHDFVDSVVRLGMDCISFSGLTDEEWLYIRSLPEVVSITRASASFDAVNPLARYFVWDRLILVGVADGALVLSNYEDSPTEFMSADNDSVITFTCEIDHSDDTSVDGHFYDAGPGYPVVVEVGMEDIVPPAELPPCEPVGMERSPMAHALSSLEHKGPDRISGQDKPELEASVRLLSGLAAFPDLMQVERKVRQYCLNPRQAEQKFQGFAEAGYLLSKPGHVEYLAALIAGALNGTFPLREARVTADRKIQFTVPVALPTLWGGWKTLTTAWVCGEDQSLSLATAFRAEEKKDGLAGSVTVPSSLIDSDDWATIYDYVCREASAYSKPFDGHGYPYFMSYLWIEHSRPRSKAFAAWIRRNTNNSSGVFTRRAFGGRVTFVRFPGEQDAVSETRAAATATHAQILLALLDIRVHPELVDL